METNKQWKRVPFDVELAKKIQSGEVEGSIYCDLGTIKILAFDLSPIKNTIEGTIIGTFTVGERELLMFDNNGVNTNRGKKYNLYIELPEEPKHEFKVGDKVRVNFSEERLLEMKINGCYQGKILTVTRIQPYGINAKGDNIKETFFMFADIEPYDEIKHEFKPFDKVLVRNNGNELWSIDFYSHCPKNSELHICIGGAFAQVIPFAGNEHLVGTTKNPE